MSVLWKILVCIIVFAGLLAIPAALQVNRSLPCTGRVIEVSESQHERRDSDGQVNTEYTDHHQIEFKNPRTGVVDSQNLDDISKKKGDVIPLLWDPSDQKIALDEFFTLYKMPVGVFGVMFVLWILSVIAVRSS